MNRIGVGFVGAGFITNTSHVNAWVGVRNADITGICAYQMDRAKVAAGLCRKLQVGAPRPIPMCVS